MANRRAARVASAVQQEVSRMLLTEVKHPGIGLLSVTGVVVNDDLSVARISYLPLNGQGDRKAIAEALKEVSKQLRGPVGRAIGTRHAPELRFEIDRNLEYAMHMNDVLAKLPKPVEDDAAGGAAEAQGARSEAPVETTDG